MKSYQDLITFANQEIEPQRLLFVFAKAEPPEGATNQQIAEFERGEGGVLTPSICVDKLPEEVPEFQKLIDESKETGFDWDIVFVAAMNGRGGISPSSDECLQPLKMMMQQIQMGMISGFLAINREGIIVQLS